MSNNWAPTAVFSTKDPQQNIEVKRNVTIKFDLDPLAFVIEMLKADLSPPHIFDILSSTDSSTSISIKDSHYPSTESIEKAETIRSFFKRRLIHRRLTNMPPTRFIEGVEEVLHSDRIIDLDKLKILVKLPIFYDQTIEVEELFSQYETFNDSEINRVELELTLVKVLQKKSKRNQMYQLFFADKDKHLYYHLVNSGNEVKLWKHLNGIGSSVKIIAHVARTKFYDTDFILGHFSSYEFTSSDN